MALLAVAALWQPAGPFAARRALGIDGSIWPAQNANGWNNSSVRVAFTCSDAPGGCTAPSDVTIEGANMVVNGTASDGNGNYAYDSVTVNIDVTPPSVVISSPSSGSTTASSVGVTATVSDALSGVDSATCNGEAAEIVSGVVSCTVPLDRGINAVVVTAMDEAGNMRSTGLKLLRTGTATTAAISPSIGALVVDDRARLVAVDEFGQVIGGGVWTSDDPAVAEIDEVGDAGVVTAIGEGPVVVTFTAGGLTADLELTVYSGPVLAAGTPRLKTPALPSHYLMDVIHPHRVTADTPATIAVEADLVESAYRARAFNAEGQQQWLAAMPSGYWDNHMAADSYGGVIVTTGTGLARFGGDDTVVPWRYDSGGELVKRPAQGTSGRIFVSEVVNDTIYAVVLDGSTGVVLARQPLPESRMAYLDSCNPSNSYDTRLPAMVSTPAVDSDNIGLFSVSTFSLVTTVSCGASSQAVQSTVALMAIPENAPISMQTILTDSYSGAPYTGGSVFTGATPVPDGVGGVLVEWTALVASTEWDQGIARVTSGGVTDHALDPNFSLHAVGDDGRAFFAHGENGDVYAVNAATWSVDWSTSVDAVSALRLEPLADGGVAVIEPATGVITTLDGEGEEVDSAATGLRGISSTLRMGELTGIREEVVNDESFYYFTSQPGPALIPAMYSFAVPGASNQGGYGNAQRQFTPRPDYGTAERAAIAWIQYMNPFSIEINKETGASICLKGSNGRYMSAVPNVGTDETVPVTPCPAGAYTWTTWYHTHAADNSPGFSGALGDMGVIENGNPPVPAGRKDAYLGTPCGTIIRYRYISGATAAPQNVTTLPDRTDTTRVCVE